MSKTLRDVCEAGLAKVRALEGERDSREVARTLLRESGIDVEEGMDGAHDCALAAVESVSAGKDLREVVEVACAWMLVAGYELGVSAMAGDEFDEGRPIPDVPLCPCGADTMTAQAQTVTRKHAAMGGESAENGVVSYQCVMGHWHDGKGNRIAGPPPDVTIREGL